MQVMQEEAARVDPSCSIRLGRSSWDHGAMSVKYAWRDKNGNVTRGGEVPVDALPQMLEMAIRSGHLKLTAL